VGELSIRDAVVACGFELSEKEGRQDSNPRHSEYCLALGGKGVKLGGVAPSGLSARAPSRRMGPGRTGHNPGAVSTSSPPSRLLNAAAREVLKPMGLIQRGKSRTWIDDHGCWLIVVNFESSGFSKGSYLAVSADFLWHDRDWLAYAVGGRLRESRGPEIWADFSSEEQFAAEARRLATRAADEVARFRSRFSTLRDWADELTRTANGHFWPQFDAGVACALVGRKSEAHQWFERVYTSKGDDRDWVLAAQGRAREFDVLLADGQELRSEISQIVRRFRIALKLDPDVELTFD
jgi:hypothetical protein